MAYGQPPQRQAMGSLVDILQVQRPQDDPLMSVLQPYIRKLLAEALQIPTPALAHAMYCFPMAFALLGIGRPVVTQPSTLDDVADQAKAWLRNAQDASGARRRVQ